MPAWRLTRAARADLRGILAASRARFGPNQALRYAALFNRAADLAAEAPHRPGSQDRSDLGRAVRSLHLGVASGRIGAAAHVLIYRPDHRTAGQVAILRVLHERMDASRHWTEPDTLL